MNFTNKWQEFYSNECSFGKAVLDNTVNLVNFCDIDSHEVLYLNRACKEAYGLTEMSDFSGKKCYELFYGKDAPCDFCTSKELVANGIHEWKVYNPKQEKYLRITDRLLQMDGRNVRLEIAVDIDEDESLIKALDNRIALDKIVFACIRTLTETVDMRQAIEKNLEIVCTYHKGSRGYIFELSADGKLLNNTYEWCAPGISAEIDNLQEISKEVASDWFVNFKEKGSFSITNLNNDLDPKSGDYRILDAQGLTSLMAAPLMGDGVIRGFIGVDDPQWEMDNISLLTSITYFILNDIQKRRMIFELESLSYVDVLTKLYNRNKYIKDLEQLEKNQLESLGVVYIDLNGLKVANDQFGHNYGDHLLKQMAALIKGIFDTKAIYRIGGDEFIVLCIDSTKDEFEIHVTQLRTSLSKRKELTASLGTTWEEKKFNINDLIKHADDLMYANKQRYYQAIQVSDYNHKSSLAKQLLGDIKAGRYIVYLQPKISLADGRLCGAEALIRGTDKAGMLIYPDNFIPLYESQGIIRHIDFYVLDTVCKLMGYLNRVGKEIDNVSVNFSRITLLEYGVVRRMQEICQKYGILPQSITIEVTESTAKLQLDELAELVAKIKEAGFCISLDDYGSKYSNLSVLSNIAFDEIKLDRSIISDLTVNDNTRTIVQYTIKMLKELKLSRVVAEGIETSAELNIVKQYGCDYGQGYHFSRPIPIWEFLEKYFPTGTIK